MRTYEQVRATYEELIAKHLEAHMDHLSDLKALKQDPTEDALRFAACSSIRVNRLAGRIDAINWVLGDEWPKDSDTLPELRR